MKIIIFEEQPSWLITPTMPIASIRPIKPTMTIMPSDHQTTVLIKPIKPIKPIMTIKSIVTIKLSCPLSLSCP